MESRWADVRRGASALQNVKGNVLEQGTIQFKNIEGERWTCTDVLENWGGGSGTRGLERGLRRAEEKRVQKKAGRDVAAHQGRWYNKEENRELGKTGLENPEDREGSTGGGGCWWGGMRRSHLDRTPAVTLPERKKTFLDSPSRLRGGNRKAPGRTERQKVRLQTSPHVFLTTRKRQEGVGGDLPNPAKSTRGKRMREGTISDSLKEGEVTRRKGS